MNLQTTIRRATLEDAHDIRLLVDAAYSPYVPRIGKKPAPMLKNYRQVVADCSVFVLTRPTQIIGVLVVDVRKPNLLLENIAVLPACKGQGAGKLLMAFCEDYARETGCEAIELYTNALMTENLEIYKKLGYQETRRAHEDGFSRVFMRKPVRPAAK